MKHKTLEELLEVGFVVTHEDKNFIWVAREIKDCEGEFAYQMVDKEKNEAIFAYAQTSSLREVELLNKISTKLYNK